MYRHYYLSLRHAVKVANDTIPGYILTVKQQNQGVYRKQTGARTI